MTTSPSDFGPTTGDRATTDVELVNPVPDGETTSSTGATSGDDHAEEHNIRSQQIDPGPPPDSAFNPVVRAGRFVLEKALPADGAWYRIRNFNTDQVVRGPTSDRLTQQDLLLTRERERIRDEDHGTQGDDSDLIRRQAEAGEQSQPVSGDPRAPGGEAHPARNPGEAEASIEAASAGGGAGDAPFTLIALVGGAVMLLTWRMTAK